MCASKIEWTDRSDWNPIRGCTRHSEACRNCYAEIMAARFSDPGQWGHTYAHRVDGAPRWTGRVRVQWDRLTLPLRWRQPVRIFANSTSDFFHESLDRSGIATIFGHAIAAVHLRGHTIQILTKRGGRMRALLSDPAFWVVANATASMLVADSVDPLARRSDDARATLRDYDLVNPVPGIWLGISIGDQRDADEYREDMHVLAAAGWMTFVSYEPALGPVDWTGWEFLDWLISGGESGPRARPTHPDWHGSTRDFRAAHRIAYFFKQWGEWWFDPRTITAGGVSFHHFPDRTIVQRVGKKEAGRLLDGIEHNAFPQVQR